MQYSIVNLSEVKQNSDFRIDSEYYKPELINMDNNIKHIENHELSEITEVITNGATPLRHDLTKGTIKFITPEFISEFFINNVSKYIFLEHHENELKRTQLKIGDVLYCIKGKIGSAVPILKSLDNYNINQDVAKIRFKNIVNSTYVATFLNTKYGILQADRYQTGQINPFLALGNLKKIKIPFFSQNFQQKIADLVNTSYSLRQSADTLYKQAENELLLELGLNDYVASNKNCFVKMLSDVEAVSRFDAEYFQPKYEAVIERIRGYKGGCFCLDECDIKDKNFCPKCEVEYKYIELANINVNSSVDGVGVVKGCNLPTRARRIVESGDLIVSSVEGSLGSVALMSEKFDGALCSTGFFVVNCRRINSESLLVFLKSGVGQMQLKRGCSGTILSAISKDEFEKVLIPELSLEVQSSISAKVRQSFQNREEALRLLDVAKKAVEVAIEKGEDSACLTL